jgi:GST-like protein
VIEFYYAPGPKGAAVALFLMESGLPFRTHHVDVAVGAQFAPEFLSISPAGQVPAIVDTAAAFPDKRAAIFGPEAILLYLAEKSGHLLPRDPRVLHNVNEWLFWQFDGRTSLAGWHPHLAPDPQGTARDPTKLYVSDVNRAYGFLDRHLREYRYLAGDEYTVADIALYPWIVWWGPVRPSGDFPHLKRWLQEIGARPATVRTYLNEAFLLGRLGVVSGGKETGAS